MILRCLYIDTPDPSFVRLENRYRAGYLDAAELEQYVARAEYGLSPSFVARELGSESLFVIGGDAEKPLGPYTPRSYQATIRCALTCKAPVGAYRGAGAPEADLKVRTTSM